MTKFNIAALNAEIAATGVELVKGKGYFYFASLDDRCIAEKMSLQSIYVNSFKQMGADRWRSAVAYSLSEAGLA